MEFRGLKSLNLAVETFACEAILLPWVRPQWLQENIFAEATKVGNSVDKQKGIFQAGPFSESQRKATMASVLAANKVKYEGLCVCVYVCVYTHCLPTFIPNSKNTIKCLSTHVGAQTDPTPVTSTLHCLFFDGESTIPFSTCTCTGHKGSTLNGHTYYPATSQRYQIHQDCCAKNPSPFVVHC